MATFALLDRLGCTFVASLFGGYVFGFSPYAFAHAYIGHAGFVQNWVYVLTVAAMLHLRARRSYARAAVAGGVVALAFYISAYVGLFAGLIATAFFLVDFVRLSGRHERVRTVALASASLLTTAAALMPIFVLYQREHSAVLAQAQRPAGDLYLFAAKFGAYLLPSPRNPLFHWLRTLHPAYLPEQTLFVGYVTMALAVAACVLIWRKNRWLRASESRWGTALSMAVLAPLAFFLSLPPSYHIGGVLVPMPSVLVGAITTFWRQYARFGSVVALALAVLAALALSALAQRPGRGWRLLGPVALAVVFVELLPGNVGVFDTRASAAPSWVSWLATQPSGIVATYPMTLGRGPADQLAKQAYFDQTVDRDPGFTNFGEGSPEFASRNQSIRLLAYDLRAPLAARVLATEGVRYVVVDPSTYRAAGQAVPVLDHRHFALLERAGKVGIYSVHAQKVNLAQALRVNQNMLRGFRGLPPLPKPGP